MAMSMDGMDGLTLTEYVADYVDYFMDSMLEKYGVDLSLVSIYVFLTEPSSSKAAFRWNLFLAVFVGFYICLILVESCDGPNKYYDRENEALYPFLLTSNEYWAVTVTCWVPLVIDAVVRMCVLCYIFGHSENEEIAEELWDDKFTLITMIGDIICVFPFLLRGGYIEPKRIRLEQGSRVLLRIIELLSISRILRSTKDIPAVKAIRITLSRAIYHLVLPIFFFFAFNVFAAVIVYFIEPCYNTRTCPWVDLFDASFYSVVTMTTTGYGDQVPYYLTTRMLALVIMIFGALFISLPLAIIGNEYDEAWTEVSEAAKSGPDNEKASVDPDKADSDTKSNDDERSRHNSKANFLGRKSAEPHGIETIREELEEENTKSDDDGPAPVVNFDARLTPMSDDDDHEDDGGIAANFNHISSLASLVKEEFDATGAINPVILLNLCELRGWLSSIRWQVMNNLKAGLSVKKYMSSLSPAPPPSPLVTQILNKNPPGRSRRLSVLGGGVKRNIVQVQPMEIDGSMAGGIPREFSERVLLTRGDSLLQQANRMRTISDISEGDASMSNELDQLEKGGGGGGGSDAVRTAQPTEQEAPTGRRSSSRRTFRGIGTIFREQLEKVGNDTAGADGEASSPRRLPARSLLIMLAKASKDVIPGGSHSADFTKKMVRAARNPNSYRSRMWMLLELPSSSREAKGLRYVLMFLIMLSVFTLYTQTLTSLSFYGERTTICGKVVDLYCSNKNDPVMDPGCFNQNVNYKQKLRFRDCKDCNDLNCFGLGRNFGSPVTNYTCENNVGAIKPFRTQEELIRAFAVPNIANLREDSHRIYAICDRVECSNTIGSKDKDGNVFWIPLEIVINVVFSVEILLRIFVAESFKDFFFDFLNIFDIFSILPFYAEVSSGGAGGIDFAVLASSPEPLILVALKSLKVFRLFKITRHFKATQVLIETAMKVWKQLIGMLSLLMFIITVFAILLFEVEQGEGCYVGDSDCNVPSDVADTLSTGQYIYINKQGELSQFPNALYGLWFSLVTMTSTGYGDLVPSTNAGLVMAVFLMLFGALYMAMPLTAAASVFYVIHESYNENKRRKKGKSKDTKKKSSSDVTQKKGSNDSIHKKGSINRIIGGGGRATVTPDAAPARASPTPIQTAAKLQNDKILKERAELAAKLDTHLQFKMDRLMSHALEISTKIEQFLRDLQCTDEEGPPIPVLEQAADIIEGAVECVAAVDKEDIGTLHKLGVEFYKITLEAKLK